tara:strand:+ start:1574 stop:1990 length:417 start_codon:yes stop_codon:yes gene_type:complete
MSKLVLDFDFDFDFDLFGISSHVSNYRLAWGINKMFEIDLERADDIELSFDLENNGSFSFYRFNDTDSYKTLHLLSNRCESGYLIPELKQIDFFIQYWGAMSTDELSSFKYELRKIPSVLASIHIDPKKLINRNNLLF